MPSLGHELPLQMFTRNPHLAVDLLDDRYAIPDYDEVVQLPSDLGECPPTEYRADAVISLTRRGEPVYSLVVEIQLSDDSVKRWSWPAYVANQRAKSRTPTDLLVICPNDETARWAAQPIELGRAGSYLFPHVVGPSQIPLVHTVEHMVGNPELAALSVIAHAGPGDAGTDVLNRWLAAVPRLDGDEAGLYFDYVYLQLSKPIQQQLEAMMTAMGATYEFQSELGRRLFGRAKEEGWAEGKAEGEAKALLTVLRARGFEVPAGVVDRINACTDADRLNSLVARAATITDIDRLFDDEA